MKVVILCGGQGTRIRDASELLPKPMLPIGDRPIVWHVMKGYAAHGFREFVLCLGYKGWVLKEYFLNFRAMTHDLTVTLGPAAAVEIHDAPAVSSAEAGGSSAEAGGSLAGAGGEDWRITLAETGESTMTGGRVRAIRRYVEADDELMLTYGDGVSDVDASRLLAFHRAHGKIATVTAVRPQGRFGEMQIDGGRVTEFNEKPQATSGLINGGFFVFDAKRIWDYLPADPGLVLERAPLQHLARDGQLVAYQHDGYWQPMDTLREYQMLNDLWGSGRAPWKIW